MKNLTLTILVFCLLVCSGCTIDVNTAKDREVKECTDRIVAMDLQEIQDELAADAKSEPTKKEWDRREELDLKYADMLQECEVR